MRTLSSVASLLVAISAASCADSSIDDLGDESLLDGVDLSQFRPDPANARGYDTLAYTLRGRFDWDSQRLRATETITLVLRDAAQTSVEFDAAVTITRVRVAGRELPFTADAEAKTVRVDLAALARRSGLLCLELELEAGPAAGLIASSGLGDFDPVASRLLYTHSEPDTGRDWLVGNHVPSDRAVFSVELTVDGDEDVVANGERVADRRRRGERTVRYLIDRPIPTYVMAFAAGQLEHTTRRVSGTPISVWHRRGLALDTEAHLDVIEDSFRTFERLLGNYPWSTYSVVLVPTLPLFDGMENATITFNLENTGVAPAHFALNAHELAHQWFGDWVTIRSFDDLWVKEGMATLLEAEAQRSRRDPTRTGRLFGNDFYASNGSSIVDRELTGVDKYSGGAYGRGAWLLNQIRSIVGEDKFWRALRHVLREHALGSIDSATLIAAFPLDADTRARAVASLEEPSIPQLAHAKSVAADGSTKLTLTLTDEAHTLLADPAITVVDAAGRPSQLALVPGQPLEVTIPAGGYIAPDERGVHPDLSGFATDWRAFFDDVVPLFRPTAPAALAALDVRSTAHQERAAQSISAPADFAALYAVLDSPEARKDLERRACEALNEAAAPEAWIDVLGPILRDSKNVGYDQFLMSYAQCGPAIAQRFLEPELERLIGTKNPADFPRLAFLLNFDYGADTLSLYGRLATESPSATLADDALSTLSLLSDPFWGFPPIAEDQLPAWKDFFFGLLQTWTTAESLRIPLFMTLAFDDERALPLVGAKIALFGDDPQLAHNALCEAARVAEQHDGSWAALVAAAQPSDALAPELQAILADPAVCSQ